MSIVCPACGKVNEESVESCRRCECALAILERITAAARAVLSDGEKSLSIGKAAIAADRAHNSYRLKKSPEAARLAFLANLAIGDFAQAEKWYMIATREEN